MMIDNATPGDKLAAELSKEYGVKVLAFKMPASPSSAIDAAVALITATMGEIDVVVANAGICIHESAENMTDAQFEDTFQVNCFSPFYLARAAHASWYPGGFKIENVKKEKVILFVSSISGVIVNIPQLQCGMSSSFVSFGARLDGLCQFISQRTMHPKQRSPCWVNL